MTEREIIQSNTRFYGKHICGSVDNEAMGIVLFPRGNTSYTEKSMFPDEDIEVMHFMNLSGRTVIPTLEDWNMELQNLGMFDFVAYYYSLSGYRANFTLELYEGNRLLGTLESHKDTSTWLRGDYSTFSFKKPDGTLILEIGANYFSGYRYGNGEVRGSLDMSKRGEITIYPASYSRSPYYSSSNIHFEEIDHPFTKVSRIKLVYAHLQAYYSNSPATMKFAQFGTIFKGEKRGL